MLNGCFILSELLDLVFFCFYFSIILKKIMLVYLVVVFALTWMISDDGPRFVVVADAVQ